MGESPTHTYYPRVDPAIIRSLRNPLRLSFLALLFILIDITYGESASYSLGPRYTERSGWVLDFFHDSIGYACLLVAYGQLNRNPAPSRTKRWLPALGVVGMLGVLSSFAGCFVGWQSGLLAIVGEVFSFTENLAALALVWTLREMCRAAMCLPLVTAWHRAYLAVAFVWVLLNGVALLLLVVMRATDADPAYIQVSSPAGVCAGMVVLVIPVGFLVIAAYKNWAWTPPGPLLQCHACGYEISNLPEPRCPECGTLFAFKRGSTEPGIAENTDA